jgi:uncharacterized membrane protein YvbJ
MARLMHCWKCGLQHPETEIVCPRCGAANAPGQSYATPPTVTSPKARRLELDWTAAHRQGHHWPGAVSLGLVLLAFVIIGALLSLVFGHG